MVTTRRDLLALAGSAVIGSAWAQAWPSRPVRLLVGFAAGGNFDMVARLLEPALTSRMGQPVIVENRPGAGGNIATEALVRAAPDGYTLLLAGAASAINATLYDNLPFRFPADVAPVAGVVRFPNVMTVSSTLPVRTVGEFIAYTKAQPGGANHGSSGNGTTQHLAGELFKSMTGVELTHVPYKGAAQAINDLLGGQVQVLFEAVPASLAFIKSDRLRALAVTSAERSEVLPGVPTLSESVAGYEAIGWAGVCAPRDTAGSLIDAVNRAVNAALADSVIRGRLTELGATLMPSSPTEFARFIAAETEKWAQVIRKGHIRIT